MPELHLVFAVAIVVALAVTGLVMIPVCFVLRNLTSKILTAVGASLFAIAAVVWGAMAFTGWALYTGGHGVPPGLAEWLGFAAINAILALGAGIPGGALGMVIGAVAKRNRRSDTGQPPNG